MSSSVGYSIRPKKEQNYYTRYVSQPAHDVKSDVIMTSRASWDVIFIVEPRWLYFILRRIESNIDSYIGNFFSKLLTEIF